MVYLFPRAAVTKQHKLDDWQGKCILSQFWKLGGYYEGVCGTVPSPRLWGSILPCLLPALVVVGSPWPSLVCSSITPVSASVITSRLSCVSVFTFDSCLFSSYRTPVILE